MTITKVQTSTTEVKVYKVPASSMNEAFHILKTERGLDDYSLDIIPSSETPKKMYTGYLFRKSQELHSKYFNNEISEFTVFGALYNAAPKIKNDDKILVHNIVSRGTKKWETVNSYKSDSGVVLYEDTGTKAEALEKAKELALEHSTTINVILSKRLVGHDGILGVAEYINYTNIDDQNIYIFWVYNVTLNEMDEDDLIEKNTVEEANRQLSIFCDMESYENRLNVVKRWKEEEEKEEQEEQEQEY